MTSQGYFAKGRCRDPLRVGMLAARALHTFVLEGSEVSATWREGRPQLWSEARANTHRYVGRLLVERTVDVWLRLQVASGDSIWRPHVSVGPPPPPGVAPTAEHRTKRLSAMEDACSHAFGPTPRVPLRTASASARGTDRGSASTSEPFSVDRPLFPRFTWESTVVDGRVEVGGRQG